MGLPLRILLPAKEDGAAIANAAVSVKSVVAIGTRDTAVSMKDDEAAAAVHHVGA